MAFTEFYMQNGGSNLNAGSTTNNTAAFTSTNGGWNNGTGVFTPTDGSTPANTVSVGDFASVYNDGATVGVYIGRVTAVAAGVNGTITVSTTVAYGTSPSTNASARSIKVGGAWAGPGGTSLFPFGLSGTIGTLINTSSDSTRINVRNDQTYTMTTALAFNSAGAALIQGYTTNPGDLGKAILTSNYTLADQFILSGAAVPLTVFTDLIFTSTAGSGSPNVFSVLVGGAFLFVRCVFHGGRVSGMLNVSGFIRMYECEAYANNQSSSTDAAGFQTVNSSGNISMYCRNCYSHDNNGTGGHGFYTSASGTILESCIADSNGGKGFKFDSTSSGALADFFNCNFYNNTGDAITYGNGAKGQFVFIQNNNFLKNGGKAVNVTATGQVGILYNNGRGSGTQANGSSDTLKCVQDTSTDVTYASGVTPWNAETTGDFSTVLAAAENAGRGAFTETDGTNTGTVGYPDIGAAMHLSSGGSAVFNPLVTTIIQAKS